MIKKQSGYKTEKLKQQLHSIAHTLDLKLEIEGPMIETDFLDLKFNLETGKYAPYRKPNNVIKYIKTDSNHPNNIIKQIPSMISKRLSKRSIDKEEFDKVAGEYNHALRDSGYQEQVVFQSSKPDKKKKQKKKNNLVQPLIL